MKKSLFIVVLSYLILFPSTSFADVQAVPDISGISNFDMDVSHISASTNLSRGTGNNPVSVVIGNVAKFVTSIIASIAIIMIVVSGIMYITSGGDVNRAEVAKKTLSYAIVGLIVSLLAFVIVMSVSTMVGV